MGKSRFGLMLDDELKIFALKESEKLGISLGAYLNLLIGQEQQRQETIKAMSNIESIVTRIENLNKS